MLKSKSPLPNPLPVRASRGEGEDRFLLAAMLNSMAMGERERGNAIFNEFCAGVEIVTLAWIDNASAQFALNIYATRGLQRLHFARGLFVGHTGVISQRQRAHRVH